MTTPAAEPGFFADLLATLWLPITELHLIALGRAHNTSYVIVGAALLGAAGGLVGCFALLRKRSLMADALSHATLPGLVAAFLIADALGGHAKSIVLLLVGAAASGVLGVVCVHWIVRHSRLREDAAIGIVLSVFFGAGIVLLGIAARSSTTPAAGLSHFIYGQTAAMTRPDALTMLGMTIVVAIACLALVKEFRLVCFNDAFAAVAGWPVARIDLMLMGLIVLVTVAGLQAVGIILVVAMLVIPPAAARFWSNRLGRMLAISAGIGGLSGYLGATLSALSPRSPAGSVIVLTAGALFVISMLAAPTRGILPEGYRRVRQKLRFATDHVLEHLYLAHEEGDNDRRPPVGPVLLAWMHLKRVVTGHGATLAPTPEGLERGRRVARNHRLWERYLILYADIAPSHVDWSVDQVEHILSPEIMAELEHSLAGRV